MDFLSNPQKSLEFTIFKSNSLPYFLKWLGSRFFLPYLILWWLAKKGNNAYSYFIAPFSVIFVFV